jgi:hypothetical protein
VSAAGDLERIFYAMETSSVRYLVTGGVAIVLRGQLRFTPTLDLFVSLEPINAQAAVDALRSLRYRPRAPVPFGDLGDPDARQSWIAHQGTNVVSFFSPVLRTTGVDVLLEEPVPFDDAYARGERMQLRTTSLMVASAEDLLRMRHEQAHGPEPIGAEVCLRLSPAERLDWLDQAKRFCSMAAVAAARLEEMRREQAGGVRRG